MKFMLYQAVVIDNNHQELSQSVEALKQSGVFKKITPFEDSLEALKYIEDHGCDIVFTEIEMKKIDGFSLGRKFGGSGLAMCFVFLTSNENYAIAAFKLCVTDFILKPISTKAIERVIKKVRDKQYFEIIG